jgi:hypothetical protein
MLNYEVEQVCGILTKEGGFCVRNANPSSFKQLARGSWRMTHPSRSRRGLPGLVQVVGHVRESEMGPGCENSDVELSREKRENNSAHSPRVHVFTRPGSDSDVTA